MDDGRYIGTSVPRIEDARFLTGRGAFVDDVHADGLLEMAILRAPFAHARIRSIDLTAARAAPDVMDVFSAEDIATDFPNGLPEIPIRLAPFKGFENHLQRPLAESKVRYVGEPVAVVIAATRYAAEDAVSLIEIDWEPLPAVVDIDGATEGATLLFDETESNVATAYTVSRGDADAAFREAEYTRREAFKTQRQSPFPMETRGLIAAFDGAAGTLRLTGATKVNYFNRRHLAAAFGLEVEKVELVEVDVGGGFGLRGELYPEDYLVPIASRRCGGRAVKWIEDRREHLIAANHSREIDCDVEIAARRDGTILALCATVRGDLGAYIRTNGGVVPSKAAQFLPGPYRIPAVSFEVQAILTNKTPVGTYRGPGRFEANFFRERLIDMMAGDLGLDPAEVRLKNLLTPADLPFALGELVPGDKNSAYDKGDYPAALQRVLDDAGYDGWKSRQGEADADGRRHGLGIACFVESSAAGPPESVRLTVGADGGIEIRTGASAMGQGLETALAQICAEVIGTDIASTTVLHGTTSLLPSGGGTFHSRNTVMAGNAMRMAAEAMRDRCLDLASLRWNTRRDGLVFESGAVRDPDTGNALTPAEIAAFATEPLTTEAAFDNEGKVGFSYGAHAAHVAVDPATGHVEVLRYHVVEEIGRILNPAMVLGQAVGGVVQGIGGALFDKFLFDADGQPLATNLGEYLVPTSTETGEIEAVALEDHPSDFNPMGFKGAGEGGIVAVGAAIGNAVVHALKGTGIELREMPFDPVSLCTHLRNATEKESAR
jgi:carbon-monoxide dehydrogenase large subunit